jgi:hypothetical protein
MSGMIRTLPPESGINKCEGEEVQARIELGGIICLSA